MIGLTIIISFSFLSGRGFLFYSTREMNGRNYDQKENTSKVIKQPKIRIASKRQ